MLGFILEGELLESCLRINCWVTSPLIMKPSILPHLKATVCCGFVCQICLPYFNCTVKKIEKNLYFHLRHLLESLLLDKKASLSWTGHWWPTFMSICCIRKNFNSMSFYEKLLILELQKQPVQIHTFSCWKCYLPCKISAVYSLDIWNA